VIRSDPRLVRAEQRRQGRAMAVAMTLAVGAPSAAMLLL
jgi:hypothetical protein